MKARIQLHLLSLDESSPERRDLTILGNRASLAFVWQLSAPPGRSAKEGRFMETRSSALLIAALLVACGGGTSSEGSGKKDGCPSAPPEDGSACDVPPASGFAEAQCSWGGDRRPQCRTSALCSNGNWSVKEPAASCADAPALPASCPESAAAASGECGDPMLACWYDDGSICRCSPCMGGSEYPICQTIDPPQWACVKPDDAPHIDSSPARLRRPNGQRGRQAEAPLAPSAA
jgi:hypothetical protein